MDIALTMFIRELFLVTYYIIEYRIDIPNVNMANLFDLLRNDEIEPIGRVTDSTVTYRYFSQSC